MTLAKSRIEPLTPVQVAELNRAIAYRCDGNFIKTRFIRNRALAILEQHNGVDRRVLSNRLGVTPRTIYSWHRKYKQRGAEYLYTV